MADTETTNAYTDPLQDNILTPTSCYYDDNVTTIDHSAFAIKTYTFLIVTVLYGVMFTAGVVGNSMVIFVVTRSRDMRNSTNLFLTNLSVSDLLVILICMPSSLLEFYMKEIWLLGRLVPFLENTVSHASLLTIVGIGVDRFYAICYPIRARSMCTTKHASRMIAVIWGLAISVTSPFLALSFTDSTRYYDQSTVTVCRTVVDNVGKKIYVVSMILAFLLVPFGVLTGLCVIMSRRLRQTSDIGTRHPTGGRRRAHPRRLIDDSRQRALRLVIAILVLFMVSVAPIRVLTLWILYSSKEDKESLGLEAYLNIVCFSRILFYFNSIANPVLYNMLSARFHEAFRRAVWKRSRRNRRRSSLSTLYNQPFNKRKGVNGDFRRRDSVLMCLTQSCPERDKNSRTNLGDMSLNMHVRHDSVP